MIGVTRGITLVPRTRDRWKVVQKRPVPKSPTFTPGRSVRRVSGYQLEERKVSTASFCRQQGTEGKLCAKSEEVISRYDVTAAWPNT